MHPSSGLQEAVPPLIACAGASINPSSVSDTTNSSCWLMSGRLCLSRSQTLSVVTQLHVNSRRSIDAKLWGECNYPHLRPTRVRVRTNALRRRGWRGSYYKTTNDHNLYRAPQWLSWEAPIISFFISSSFTLFLSNSTPPPNTSRRGALLFWQVKWLQAMMCFPARVCKQRT